MAKRSESNLVVIIMVIATVLGAVWLIAGSIEAFRPLLGQFESLFASRTFLIVAGGLLVLSLAISIFNFIKAKYRERTRRDSKEHVISLTQRLSDEELREHFFKWLSPQEIQAYIKALSDKEPLDIIQLVDFMLVQAAGQRASDIHLEPLEDKILMKFRIDGVIHEISMLDKRIHPRLVSRLRVMSNLAIYEKGVPQDGRLTTKIMGTSYEVRISIMPTLHGEKTVIRLFGQEEMRFSLDQLGMNSMMLEQLTEVIRRPQGIIFLTGPTGSGKTTTIYSLLKAIYDMQQASVNIVTIEDPIEHDVEQFNQSQVNNVRGLSFASGLRTILRQDPDVIMVGEIRDFETAEIAIRAGMTGHLVVTTIHADSPAGVFNRLIEMHIEPFLLSSATSAVLSQRLLRKLCPHCREPAIPPLSLLERAGIPPDREQHYFTARGCGKCIYRGFQGRTGIFELLVVNDRIRDMIAHKSSTHEIRNEIRRQGVQSLMEDGLRKVDQGITSLQELLRVTM
ncbi:type II/IV secretion system protein [bacterium]|nr:type II/IV secretion system protein [candidate division CSSED10-310 bacterium]